MYFSSLNDYELIRLITLNIPPSLKKEKNNNLTIFDRCVYPNLGNKSTIYGLL